MAKTAFALAPGAARGTNGTRFKLRSSLRLQKNAVAVGTTIADRPPHRSVRAELPHTAPTSDVLRQTVRRGKDAEHGAEESTFRMSVVVGPIPASAFDYDGAMPAATAYTDGPGIFPAPRC